MPAGAERLAAVSEALAGTQSWFVGGVVRDALLERPLDDVDVVTSHDAEAAARLVAKAVRGAVFPLSEEFGGWRVVPHEGGWQIDISPLADGGLEADLAQRDLTVNAMARPISATRDEIAGAVVDLHGGLADLSAKTLRAVGPAAFTSDPLRVARLARLSCTLGFSAYPQTLALAQASAAQLVNVAGERVLSELLGLLGSSDPVGGLRAFQTTGGLAAVIPEVSEITGLEQSVYHHLDVWEHTLEAISHSVELQVDPTPLGPSADAAAELMAQPLADGIDRWVALRLGLLLHDIAKGQTQMTFPNGKIGFPGHDRLGATIAADCLDRLRGSKKLRDWVSAEVLHHLDLGFMTDRMPVGARDVHSYLLACGTGAVDITVVSVADRLATRGRNSEVAIAKHLELASEVLTAACAREIDGLPEPLVRGDKLASELGIRPGPELGELIAEIEAARFAGEVATADEAVDHARRHRASHDG